MGLQYIPPERLFWDQAPAVPLMTSSISWGLLEHDYGDLQFIHICCCVEFLCTRFSCSELCDLLLWASGTANSQQWLSKDHVKTCSIQLHVHLIAYRTTCVNAHMYPVLDKCHYYITEAHVTSVTVKELLYSRAAIANYKNVIKYVEADRCYHPHINQLLPHCNMMKVDDPVDGCKMIILTVNMSEVWAK